MKPKGVTTPVKALDEYSLMVPFVLLVEVVDFFFWFFLLLLFYFFYYVALKGSKHVWCSVSAGVALHCNFPSYMKYFSLASNFTLVCLMGLIPRNPTRPATIPWCTGTSRYFLPRYKYRIWNKLSRYLWYIYICVNKHKEPLSSISAHPPAF